MSQRIPQAQLDALAEGVCTLATTGTNGKTTTTGMLAAIARAAGQRVARVTTLGMWVDDERTAEDGSMRSFVRTMERARALGARTLALEVTSRALEGGFAERWPADIAVFTNLTPDHLDRHGTPERYLAAKAQLFMRLRAPGIAVLNADDPSAALLSEVLAPGVRVLRYSGTGSAADLCADAVEGNVGGSDVVLGGERAQALGGRLRVATAGRFNVDNALAAALAAHAAGFDPHAISAGLAAFGGVEGRFQVLCEAPLCVVDFAHTPDGLARALESTRALVAARGGRVACVFGCGGERDSAKRPAMGAIASRAADAVWLTTDNPRSEDPVQIAAMVRSGAREAGGLDHFRDVPERAAAIEQAVRWARPADAVLVAGRGHERFQEIAGARVASADRDLLQQALARRSRV